MAIKADRTARASDARRMLAERGPVSIPDLDSRGGLPLRTNVEPWKRKHETYEWDCPACGTHNAKHWSTCSACNERRPPKEETE